MNRTARLPRRVLTVLLAVTPLLASADLCTVGALTGRADLSCAMESGAPACRVAPAPAPKCSHCTPAAPAKETPRSQGPTCCDLRPLADGASGQAALTAPSPVLHPVATLAPAAPVISPTSALAEAGDDGRAPPGEVPALLSPRAPPLA